MDRVEVATDPARPHVGRFLRACEFFQVGELIVHDTELLRVPGLFSSNLRSGGYHKLSPKLFEAADSLKRFDLWAPKEGISVESLRREANEIWTHFSKSASTESINKEDVLYLLTVLHHNSFAGGVGGNEKVMFKTLSMLNHSCLPNCIVDADEGSLRAIRPVQQGEELTVSYLPESDLLRNRDTRQKKLRMGWGFKCGCVRCSAHFDDTRRFLSLHHEDCFDLPILATSETGHPWWYDNKVVTEIHCTQCKVRLEPTEETSFLLAEASAEAALERARVSDMEEDEGQELIRCYRFAAKHPEHYISLELAHDFEFPDPVESRRCVLRGAFRILGKSYACELTLRTSLELAELLWRNGEEAEAKEMMEDASIIAAVVDGPERSEELQKAWPPSPELSRRCRGSARGSAPPPASDLDLDLGRPSTRPSEAEPAASSSGALQQQPSADSSARSPAAEREAQMKKHREFIEMLQKAIPALPSSPLASKGSHAEEDVDQNPDPGDMVEDMQPSADSTTPRPSKESLVHSQPQGLRSLPPAGWCGLSTVLLLAGISGLVAAALVSRARCRRIA